MRRAIEGYENIYEISEDGIIYSLPRKIKAGNKYGTESFRVTKAIEKKQFKTREGYMIVELKHNKINKKFSVHRLVAKAFIPNPDAKLQVNHKDCDKTNNRVENLEWCTKEENEKHAWENGRKHFKGNKKQTIIKLLGI